MAWLSNAQGGTEKPEPSFNGEIASTTGTGPNYKVFCCDEIDRHPMGRREYGQISQCAKEFMPNNEMAVSGLKKAKEQENVIAYLKSISN